MQYLDLVLRWLHILGAIALMGGSIFIRFSVLPTFQSLSDSVRQEVESGLRARWARVVMIAITFLLVSGLINMGTLASRYQFRGLVTTPQYHALLGIKFLLALPIFFIASRLAGRSEAAAKFRQNARFWVNLNLVLALLIVLIGGVLRFAERVPKSVSRLPAPVHVVESA